MIMMKGLSRMRRPVLLPVLAVSILALLVVALLLVSPRPADAQPNSTAWYGIVPGDLDEGDKYRILFVTSGTRNAASSDIGDYNTFVQNAAAGATGDPFAEVTFKVLGSTDDVDARCNTLTHASPADCGNTATVDDAPIYYYRGARVAASYAGLYDGAWDSQAPRDENGNSIDVSTNRVSTGSQADGTVDSNALGNSQVRIGMPSASGQELNSAVAGNRNSQRHFYALSVVLTVPALEIDYDENDDGLIEIADLTQLDAMRWDLDGGGDPASANSDDYAAAFPHAAAGMGCGWDDPDDNPDAGATVCRGYELMADLDFDTDDDGATHTNGVGDADDAYYNADSGWEPIAASLLGNHFEATFKGNGHTIANLFINRDSAAAAGLFGIGGVSSEFRNVGLVNLWVHGGDYVGGLVGTAGGSVGASYATGKVSGQDFVGGLVGDAVGSGITASYYTGGVSGRDYVGGLVGQNSGSAGRISSSFAASGVSGRNRVGGLAGVNDSSAITDSYSTGSVSGNTSVGGLVGWTQSGTITASYWDTDTSGIADDADTDSPEGRTTTEIQAPTSASGIYATWDADVWDFGDAGRYPALKADFDGNGTATAVEFGDQGRNLPARVRGVSAQATSTDAVTLTWDAPDDGGSAITGYTVERSEDDGASWADQSHSGTTASLAQSGLTPGTTYSYRVKATNANGDSVVWSETASATPDPPNEPPAFDEGTEASRTVAENTAAGQDIGNPVSATDPDTGDTLTYSLGGTDAATFAIDSASGQLQTKAALDFEDKHEYNVTVTVTDGELTDTIDVTINVTDVNEAPAFAEGTEASRTVPENTASGQDIGNPVAATDPDAGGTLTYSLGGDDAASFGIVSTTGQIRTAAALDFEDKHEYNVTVTVTDGDLTDTIDVTINVTDVNEPPAFGEGAEASRTVAENTAAGQDIGAAVSATDPDSGDTLTYSLGGTDGASFAIVSTSGQLRTAAALDFETKNQYDVTVTVTDGSGLTDTIAVTINVTNVNEPGVVTISPAQPKVDVALTAALTDPDGGVTGATWQWARSSDGSTWTDIAGATNAGYTPTGADYAHQLQATASYTDAEGPSKSAAAATAGKTHSVDRDTLIAVYDATNGDGWAHSAGWKSAQPIGEWRGVTVDGDGRVTHLSLSSNQLEGEIPVQLSDLDMLEHLDLGHNKLSGQIPSVLGSLTNLTALGLHDNQLTGGIRTELGSLTNLTALTLNDNQLTGVIPTQLGSLTNLTLLWLSNNDLSGSIPPELGATLNSLDNLTLSGNRLTGCVPVEWESIANNDFQQLMLPFCGRSVTVSTTTVEVAEDGGATEYTVTLDGAPSGTVNIALTSDDTGVATVSPATLSFTTGDWETEQTVTATGVDDDRYNDPARTAIIAHAVSDGGYDFVTAPSVTVTATDDEPSPPATCSAAARWCATLLVGGEIEDDPLIPYSPRGYCRPASGQCGDKDKYGYVSDPGFTLDGTDYTVQSVRWGLTGIDDWFLSLTLDQDLPQAALSQLSIHESPEESSATNVFRFTNSEKADDSSAYVWAISGGFYGSSNRDPDKRLTFELVSSVPLPTVATPGLSIADATVTEGDSGSTDLTFTATLNPANAEEVTVDYATADGTATAGSDYTAKSGQLTFAANETSQTITVAVAGDTAVESYETFTVTLSNPQPTSITLNRATATGYIIDNVAGAETGSGVTLSVENIGESSADVGFTNYPYGADWWIALQPTASPNASSCTQYNAAGPADNPDTPEDESAVTVGEGSIEFTSLTRGAEYGVSVNAGANCATAQLASATFRLLDSRLPTARARVVDENGVVTDLEDAVVQEGSGAVTVDGSLSSDPSYDASDLTYTWSISDGLTLSATSGKRTSFEVPNDLTQDKQYVVSLTVEAPDGDFDTDYLTVDVLNIPDPGLQFVRTRDSARAMLTGEYDQSSWWYRLDHQACTEVASARYVDIENLDSNTSYRFRVYYDSACTTKIADQTFQTLASNINTMLPALVPLAPAAPTFGAVTRNSLAVTWTAPFTPVPPISDYDVRYRVGSSGSFTNAGYDGTATSHTITGLTAGTTYQVQVRANNANGNGPWSASGTRATTSGAWLGIVPTDLDEGDKYRILFVTSTTRNAQSSNINAYNNFVQDQANEVTALADITFKALGSTADVDARCNTQTHRQDSHCPGVARVDDVPIYHYRGKRAADHYSDFYDGDWDSQKPRNHVGAAIGSGERIWTGSEANGTGASGLELGSAGTVTYGQPNASGLELRSSATAPRALSGRLYALSEVLTVPVNDYDVDDDGLIEIADLAQMNAVRWDLDGDGDPVSANSDDYAAAFPDPIAGMGCGWDDPNTPGTTTSCRGYELMADLDFDTDDDGATHTNGVGDADDAYYNAGSGWEPIGTSSTSQFSATLEGNGRAIGNLFINRGSETHVGLFGNASANSEIRNVGIVDAHVTGQIRVGGLVGASSGRISASYASGSVSGSHNNVGGLVGYSSAASIADSYATASVSGNRYVGGLLGLADGGSITDSYATGSVSGRNNLGGLVGRLNLGGTITASYWDADTSGIADDADTDSPEGLTTTQLQAPTSATGIYATWDSGVWDFGDAGRYPALKFDTDGDGTATAAEFGDQGRNLPARVQGVSAEVTAADTVTLTWTAPDDGGSAITGYTVERSEDHGGTWVDQSHSGTTATLSQTGLTGGATYSYRVKATNANGDSVVWSETDSVLTWNGIVPPDVQPGEKYRILFLTGELTATHSSIDSYNTIVQGQADNAAGNPFAGITFKILGSTADVHARNNTDTNQNVDGAGEPIYYYQGHKVADDYADLYDADGWDSQQPRDRNGQIISGTVDVHTGSVRSGATRSGYALGDSEVQQGQATTAGAELRRGSAVVSQNTPSRFYALSEVLTAPVIIDWAPPNLQAGDKYRVLFVTSNAREASNPNIGNYNTFVQNRADTVPALAGADFKALGSTESVDARCNTLTHTADSQCPGVARVDDAPIYYYLGEKVADHYGDFYNGDWDSQEPRNEDGELISGNPAVFTGSSSSGVGVNNRELGSGGSSNGIRIGRPATSGDELSSGENRTKTNNARIYGLSEVLTAPPRQPRLTLTLRGNTGSPTVSYRASGSWTVPDGESMPSASHVEAILRGPALVVSSWQWATTFSAAVGEFSLDYSASLNRQLPLSGPGVGLSKNDMTPFATATAMTLANADPGPDSVALIRSSSAAIDYPALAAGDTLSWTGGGTVRLDNNFEEAFRPTAIGQTFDAPGGAFRLVIEENNPATGRPDVSGTLQTGYTLSATPGDIADPDGLVNAEYQYRWQSKLGDDSWRFAGSNEPTLLLTSEHVDSRIRVQVTFTDDAGSMERLVSLPTDEVESGPSAAIAEVTPDGGSAGDPLTEGNLDGATLAVQLTDAIYRSEANLGADDFDLETDVPGLSIDSVTRNAPTRATLALAHDGADFDADATLAVTVRASGTTSATPIDLTTEPVDVASSLEAGDTDCDAGEVWCATLTVAARNGSRGYYKGETGALSDAEFNYAGANNEVISIIATPSTIAFALNLALPEGVLGLGTFTVGTHDFVLADATIGTAVDRRDDEIAGSQSFTWPIPAEVLSYFQNVGTEVGVALTAPAGATDYDQNDDGLIEIADLAQLNAMRWDLDGDGDPVSANSDDYAAAFPGAAAGMGCGWDDPETTETTTACRGYELMADLDFDTDRDGSTHINGVGDADDAYYNSGSGWEPIGDDTPADNSERYNAIFEGNDHTISNLYVSRDSTPDVGLFGSIGTASVVRNLGVAAVSVTGGNWTGGLVGSSYGEITNSHTAGAVAGGDSFDSVASFVGGLVGFLDGTGSVSGSYSAAAVSAKGADVGGLAGQNKGAISNSYATGSVSIGGYDYAGGLVGRVSTGGSVAASYATGSVSGKDAIGGLVGEVVAGGTITASYATGSVSGRLAVGGLVGDDEGGSITDSYATGSISGDTDVGGLVGRRDSGTTIGGSYWDADTSGIPDDADTNSPEGQTTTQLQAPTSASGIYATWDADVWDFGDAGRYPALKADFDGDGTATAAEFGDQGRNLPARVRGVSAQATSTDAVTLTWDAPDDGGSAITGYTVERSEDDGATWTDQSHSGTTASLAQSGLTPGTTYSYRVKATNANGDSVVWSETASALPAATPTWNGIIPPGIQPGEKYRILFVTSGEYQAGNPAIGVHDGRVQSGIGAGHALAGVTFKALASTAGGEAVDARCNTQTHGELSQCDATEYPLEDDAKIFYYLGDKVADSYEDFYDGDWDSQEPRNEDGELISGNPPVFTGTSASGVGVPTRKLGGSNNKVRIGRPTTAGNELSSGENRVKTNNARLYGLSEVLTAPGALSIDYDQNDDGLIEVSTLAQLNAMRWDLDGDGDPASANAADYAAAFPNAAVGMGCGWDDPDTTETTTACRGYELMADLDFDTDRDGSTHTNGVGDPDDDYYNSGSGWEPIRGTGYGAILEGNGHTIANLFINRGSETRVGLFAITLNSSEIRNLGIVDAKVTGDQYVGRLVGASQGRIATSYATGSVSGTSGVGGLVGWAASGSITHSYATGNVSGSADVGGLVGEGGSNIFAPPLTITATYATSDVSGSNNVGGLVGN